MVDILFSTLLVPIADAVLSAGIPLPMVPGVELKNTTLQLTQDYILLGSSFIINMTAPAPVQDTALPVLGQTAGRLLRGL
jgi:hypothetical protein